MIKAITSPQEFAPASSEDKGTEASANAPVDSAAPDIKTDDQREEAKPVKESVRFAQLSRKEKQLQKEREALKAAQAELEAKYSELEKWQQSKPTNPLEALQRAGFSYEDATAFLLNDSKPTEEMSLKAIDAKIESMKAEQKAEKERAEKEAAEAKKRHDEEVMAQFRESVHEFVNASPEVYELTVLNQQHDLVYDVIEEHFQKTGKILETKVAADWVEKELEEQVLKNAAAKKVAAKVRPQPQEDQKQGVKQPVQSKTLSNSLSATTAAAKAPANSEKERFNRALAKLEGRST